MAEYEREFFRLSHYARSLLATSRETCKRFEVGLKPSLRIQVVGFRHENIFELISQALKLERIELEGAPDRGKTEKEKSGKPVDLNSSGNAEKEKELWRTEQ